MPTVTIMTRPVSTPAAAQLPSGLVADPHLGRHDAGGCSSSARARGCMGPTRENTAGCESSGTTTLCRPGPPRGRWVVNPDVGERYARDAARQGSTWRRGPALHRAGNFRGGPSASRRWWIFVGWSPRGPSPAWSATPVRRIADLEVSPRVTSGFHDVPVEAVDRRVDHDVSVDQARRISPVRQAWVGPVTGPSRSKS